MPNYWAARNWLAIDPLKGSERLPLIINIMHTRKVHLYDSCLSSIRKSIFTWVSAFLPFSHFCYVAECNGLYCRSVALVGDDIRETQLVGSIGTKRGSLISSRIEVPLPTWRWDFRALHRSPPLMKRFPRIPSSQGIYLNPLNYQTPNVQG